MNNDVKKNFAYVSYKIFYKMYFLDVLNLDN